MKSDENALPDEFSLEGQRSHLESLAIAAYIDLMTNEKVDPSIRKSAADSVMKAVGKDAPVRAELPKGQQPLLVMQFGDQLKQSLSGLALITKDVGHLDLTGGSNPTKPPVALDGGFVPEAHEACEQEEGK